MSKTGADISPPFLEHWHPIGTSENEPRVRSDHPPHFHYFEHIHERLGRHRHEVAHEHKHDTGHSHTWHVVIGEADVSIT